MNDMKEIYELFIRTEREKQLYEKAAELANRFRKRAHLYDEQAAFPFENFAELKKEQFLSLTIPEKYGGQEISLYEFLLVQETIAQGDAATALSLGWHLGIIMNIAQERKWRESVFSRVCKEIIQYQYLINSAQSEKATGSPARGGRPETTAKKCNGNWTKNVYIDGSGT
jgi:alkylation response protein AidB-like acyl-CoA dehydrogenase